MKTLEMRRAQALRRLGWPLRAIAKQLHCSKSSVSRWIWDIPLTATQIARLRTNQAKGRAEAANHPNSPKHVWSKIRRDIMTQSAKEISPHPSPYILKVLGSALYWAEGYKAGRNMVNFSNSDPLMIKLMMRFFRETCGVPHSKFRGVVNIHPHLDAEKAQRFWSRTSGISLRRFHKAQQAVSKASKHKRDTLPLGTFRIIISDTRLQCRIRGWMAGFHRWAEGE